MLNRVKTLTGYSLACLDGIIGTVKEFYFDDQFWVIRYLVVDTGDWLPGRQVLISPHAMVAVMKEGQHIAINLKKQQIEDSPSLDSDKPVSRQFEERYHEFYGWPMYWGGPFMWGSVPYIVRDPATRKESDVAEKPWDPHLRSTYDVTGHYIVSNDGEFGHVEDFVIDDEIWAIRYLIIDTENWWPGRKVLVSSRWIERVSWSESKVFVNLSHKAIRQSPDYSEASLTREYEAGLHRHYKRTGYWDEESSTEKHSR